MLKIINHKIQLSAALLIILSFFGLLTWYSMPIYPDEVAVRWIAGRYIQDNGIAQKLFHYCAGNLRETPIIFVIPALIFSWIDLTFSLVSIRVLPFLIILCAIGLSIGLVIRKGNPYAAILATTALVGVAGSGLILARSEYIQVLNITCCLGAMYFIESGAIKVHLRYGLVFILMISLLMSLYGHIQGLLFLPLTLFILFQLLCPIFGKSRTAILMASFLLFAIYSTISLHKFSCSEHPEIVQYTTDMVINLEKIQSFGIGKYAWVEIKKYYLSFLYKAHYQIDYLPGVVASNSYQTALLNVLNLGVVTIVLLNLFFFLYVALKGGIFLSKQIGMWATSSLNSRNVSKSFEQVLTLLLIVLPVLFMFFYDSDKNFYRSFFINLLIAIVLAVVVSRRFKYTVPDFGKVYFWLCGIVVVSSTVANIWWFKDKLDAGFEGPSIAVNKNWDGIRKDVNKLANECGMDLTKGKIVVDDLTYDSLKSHSYLYPITYIHLSALLTGVKPINVIREVKPNYILARCDSFNSAGLDSQQSRGGLCCQNFNLVDYETKNK